MHQWCSGWDWPFSWCRWSPYTSDFPLSCSWASSEENSRACPSAPSPTCISGYLSVDQSICLSVGCLCPWPNCDFIRIIGEQGLSYSTLCFPTWCTLPPQLSLPWEAALRMSCQFWQPNTKTQQETNSFLIQNFCWELFVSGENPRWEITSPEFSSQLYHHWWLWASPLACLHLLACLCS